MDKRKPHQVLKQYWGYDAFREPQLDIIESVLHKKDTLALLPTGGGKSICFQVPGLILEGITLVISPLIALMKDQVENLLKRNINATFINSTLPKSEQRFRLEGVKRGFYKFLYISPERLQTDEFKGYINELNISLIAVDEAHCISQWGYDFRPEYLQICQIRTRVPNVPCLALTASATPLVQQDICEKLAFKNPQIFKKSFERPNIQYVVLYDENKLNKIFEIFSKIQGTGLIYVRTRKKTLELADILVKNGIRAEPYHGGLSTEIKNQIQKRWIENETRVIVCTNAFGMGIDKPDVRVVIHWEIPEDLESYYQEAGRAGRDEKKSYAVLFYNPNDAHKKYEQVISQYPDLEVVIKNANRIYDYLKIPMHEMPSESIPISTFKNLINQKILTYSEWKATLKILALAGFIHIEDASEYYHKLKIITSPQAFHEFLQKYPLCEKVMEILLRELGGELFTNYVAFNLKEFEPKYHIDESVFLQKLNFMKQFQIIDFQPAIQEPYIFFLKPRQPFHSNNLKWELISFLKEQALNRLKAMIEYAEHKHVCRSKKILKYFGEKNIKLCGKCDVCLGRHKIQNVSYALEDEILRIVSEGECNYQKILQKVKTGNSEEAKVTLRKLVEQNVLEIKNYEVYLKNPRK